MQHGIRDTFKARTISQSRLDIPNKACKVWSSSPSRVDFPSLPLYLSVRVGGCRFLWPLLLVLLPTVSAIEF